MPSATLRIITRCCRRLTRNTHRYYNVLRVFNTSHEIAYCRRHSMHARSDAVARGVIRGRVVRGSGFGRFY